MGNLTLYGRQPNDQARRYASLALPGCTIRLRQGSADGTGSL